MTVRAWPFTRRPVRACGVTTPSSVLNWTSITASSGNGFMARRVSVASLVVAPSAKYQLADADDAHWVTLSPRVPVTATSATASPPFSSTTADANVAVTTSASRTLARLAGPTSMGAVRLSPLSGKTVTVPLSPRAPALATTIDPSAAGFPARAPGQYQADERALTG